MSYQNDINTVRIVFKSLVTIIVLYGPLKMHYCGWDGGGVRMWVIWGFAMAKSEHTHSNVCPDPYVCSNPPIMFKFQKWIWAKCVSAFPLCILSKSGPPQSGLLSVLFLLVMYSSSDISLLRWQIYFYIGHVLQFQRICQ